MFLYKIKQDIDADKKTQAYEKKIAELSQICSNLKMEYDNLFNALCHKKDKLFLDVFTEVMEKNGLVRINQEENNVLFSYQDQCVIKTSFPHYHRERELIIGLSYKNNNYHNSYYRNDIFNNYKTITFKVMCYIKYQAKTGKYSSNETKNENYYQEEIKNYKYDIESIKKINIDTDIKISVRCDYKESYHGISNNEAVEYICMVCDKNIS
jgi:hypothetical protein